MKEIILKIPNDCNYLNNDFIMQNIQFINSKVFNNPVNEINEMKMIFEPNRK